MCIHSMGLFSVWCCSKEFLFFPTLSFFGTVLQSCENERNVHRCVENIHILNFIGSLAEPNIIGRTFSVNKTHDWLHKWWQIWYAQQEKLPCHRSQCTDG